MTVRELIDQLFNLGAPDTEVLIMNAFVKHRTLTLTWSHHPVSDVGLVKGTAWIFMGNLLGHGGSITAEEAEAMEGKAPWARNLPRGAEESRDE